MALQNVIRALATDGTIDPISSIDFRTDKKCVKSLDLAINSNVNIMADIGGILEKVITRGYIRSLKLLASWGLRKYTDKNKYETDINHAFKIAAEHNDHNLLLIFYNGFKNGIHHHGLNEAFLSACKNGNFKSVRFLHIQGADILYRNHEAIKLASYHNHLDVVKYLHVRGGNIFVDNNTPINYAKINGYKKMIKYFSKHEFTV
jgi:ankyrin repeat protein